MIRYVLVLSILFICCTPKKNAKNQEETILEDIITQKTDSVPNVPNKSDSTNTGAQEKMLTEYIIEDTQGLLYNPYDFPLEVESIKALLGYNVEVNEEYVDDENGSYLYTVIHYQDTEISFYDFGGHEARITTPKLSVLEGIKIGMKKTDFIKAMKFSPEKTASVNIFSLTDTYGNMNFSFRSDTLYLITGYYQEGD